MSVEESGGEPQNHFWSRNYLVETSAISYLGGMGHQPKEPGDFASIRKWLLS